MKYLVAYELMNPGQNYSAVHNAIYNLDYNVVHIKPALSMVTSQLTSLDVYNAIITSLDANDKLFIVDVTGRQIEAYNTPYGVGIYKTGTLQ